MVNNKTCAYLGSKRNCQRNRIIFLLKSNKKRSIAEACKSQFVDLSSKSDKRVRQTSLCVCIMQFCLRLLCHEQKNQHLNEHRWKQSNSLFLCPKIAGFWSAGFILVRWIQAFLGLISAKAWAFLDASKDLVLISKSFLEKVD